MASLVRSCVPQIAGSIAVAGEFVRGAGTWYSCQRTRLFVIAFVYDCVFEAVLIVVEASRS